MKDKVSIVIPVYNVEKYLKRCLESIINQTYKNLEIIVVDDGSTDSSGKICDEYQKLDNRVFVIHQNNGGLSDARNAGTNYASGEYLLYVDSDDWIDLDTVEKLIINIKRYNSDIAICGVKKIVNNKMELLEWFDNDTLLSKNEAMQELLSDMKIKSFAWNKLYSKKVYKTIKWPKGKLYEDIRIMHFIFEKCETISVVGDYLYNYYQREDSIDNNIKMKNKIEQIEAFYERLKYIKENNKMYDYNLYLLTVLITSIFTKIKFKNNEYAENKNIIKKYVLFVKKCRKNEEVKKLLSLKEKIVINLFVIFRTKANTIFRMIKKFKFLKKFKKEKEKVEVKFDSNRKKIVLMGSPEYNNLGDHAIAYATRQFITDNFKDYDYIEITEKAIKYNIEDVKKIINSEDILLLQGGGNTGDIYPDQVKIRKIVLNNFENKIILMPQTIQINTNNKFEYFNKVNCFAREQKSYEIMKKLFSKVWLCPDIVMYLIKDKEKYSNSRSGALLCLRNDKEKNSKNISSTTIKNILEDENIVYKELDTLANENVSINARNNYLKNVIKEFSESNLVITDRLHGMIIAAITNTPCIVLPTFNHKLVSSYNWLKNLNYIKLLEDNNIKPLINELYSINKKDNISIEKYYDNLKQIIDSKE